MILLIPLVTVIVNYHNEFHQENINNNGGLLNAGNENANISLNDALYGNSSNKKINNVNSKFN